MSKKMVGDALGRGIAQTLLGLNSHNNFLQLST